MSEEQGLLNGIIVSLILGLCVYIAIVVTPASAEAQSNADLIQEIGPAVCETLDENGVSAGTILGMVGALMAAGEETGVDISPERAGMLIGASVKEYCPEHGPELLEEAHKFNKDGSGGGDPTTGGRTMA